MGIIEELEHQKRRADVTSGKLPVYKKHEYRSAREFVRNLHDHFFDVLKDEFGEEGARSSDFIYLIERTLCLINESAVINPAQQEMLADYFGSHRTAPGNVRREDLSQEEPFELLEEALLLGGAINKFEGPTE